MQFENLLRVSTQRPVETATALHKCAISHAVKFQGYWVEFFTIEDAILREKAFFFSFFFCLNEEMTSAADLPDSSARVVVPTRRVLESKIAEKLAILGLERIAIIQRVDWFN